MNILNNIYSNTCKLHVNLYLQLYVHISGDGLRNNDEGKTPNLQRKRYLKIFLNKEYHKKDL